MSGTEQGAAQVGERVYVGLGGNVGDVRATLARAIAAIRGLPGVLAVRESSHWETSPVGPVPGQGWFVNAAVELVVDDAVRPRLLMAALLGIERSLGRDRAREAPQGPRTIDLDLLAWGARVLDDPGPPAVVLPHPRLATRAFALAPLVELAGESFHVPLAGRAGTLLVAALADPSQVVRALPGTG